ncbi:hypothetical protein EVAR_78269_1 [Eumeta japonica]|uniref:Uncharacterized protein n=1 Tax=Eumeta variegata TaxID=151549 RepID=A0A4C1T3X0_EUMVA|nr:hypothetical protein EVAR_78269_1 [Eumeta japonica]
MQSKQQTDGSATGKSSRPRPAPYTPALRSRPPSQAPRRPITGHVTDLPVKISRMAARTGPPDRITDHLESFVRNNMCPHVCARWDDALVNIDFQRVRRSSPRFGWSTKYAAWVLVSHTMTTN